MDGSNQPVNPSESTNKPNGLNLIKAVWFEVFFVLVVLFLLLAGLNYFRILRLESINPIFSVLPHTQQTTPTNQTTSNNIQQPVASPTPIQLSPDAKLVKGILDQVIQPTYSAQIAALAGHTGKDKSIVTFSWEVFVGNNPMTGTIKIKSEGGKQNTTLYISAKTDAATPPLTSSQANQLVNTYFTNPKISTWQCSTEGQKSTCTSETVSGSEKVKIIISATKDIPNRVFIRNCSALSGTQMYSQSNYCLL